MGDNEKKPFDKRSLIMPLVAFGLEIGCLFVGWLGFLMGMFGFIALLIALFMPIAGIIVAVVGLCLQNRNKISIALCIVAIVLPILVVLITIILFSTGVFVIALM